MLVIPETSPRIASIVGIDPGTDTLGTAVLYFDILTLEIVSLEMRTYAGKRQARNSWESETFGDKLGRLHWHEENLFQLFVRASPFAIASEAPFIGRFPAAGIALTEAIGIIRNAAFRYNPTKVVQLYDPPSVKLSVGAKGDAGKDAVLNGLMRVAGHAYIGEIPLNQVDEHSSDAGAVAICQLNMFRGGLPCRT